MQIIRPGGMERPTDAYKETHNLLLAKADTYSGSQVSNLQVCLSLPGQRAAAAGDLVFQGCEAAPADDGCVGEVGGGVDSMCREQPGAGREQDY